MNTQKARFLVKTDELEESPGMKLGAAGNLFPLASRWKLGASEPGAAGKQWSGYELEAQATVAELWDAAHERAAEGLVIEPDIENVWRAPLSKTQHGLFAGSEEADRGVVNLQSDQFPRVRKDGQDVFAWHLNDEFSQLRSAREAISAPQTVRAAILDVGYDYQHEAMPRLLRSDLQRNFTDDGRTDALDPDTRGPLKNPGHGTATIALLAGNRVSKLEELGIFSGPLGGAPDIEVVPLRVADSVLMLKTSAFAKAIAYLLTLQGNPATAIDVVSMSMGGVASRLWADVVNRAYEAGIVIVSAAGNNFGRPKSIVFPARFRRVLAACGVMGNYEPYVLPFRTMSGNYGPSDKMATAIAAFTPNISWAEIGSKSIVDSDGQGTSSATPQVAAAAALWLQKHKGSLAEWEGWRRVEMVRKALFQSADRSHAEHEKYFGQGVLRARKALEVAATAAARASLKQQKADSAAFAFFRALRGTVFAADDRASAMDESFDLELTQLLHRDPDLEIHAPEAGWTTIFAEDESEGRIKAARQFADAVIASRFASRALKQALRVKWGGGGSGGASVPTGSGSPAAKGAGGTILVAKRIQQSTPQPSQRKLRLFAFDPSAKARLSDAPLAEATVSVPWETLSPGPSGEYVEVVDHDPASGCFYPPVDLEHPYIAATHGLAPEEGNPGFHQQMVYGVAMRTIDTFERALGRRVLWSPKMDGRKEVAYVQKLRIYPHALREKNAYYNPLKKALLFGYFPATPLTLDTQQPGGMVFTCLSHDVIAHEMTHAILDGVARDLVKPTNPDMLAFHEAFADLVALFQHFSLPDVVKKELARTRGNLRTDNWLVTMARQFGTGIGLHGALRSYLGSPPKPDDYSHSDKPHTRGAVLVAAIFDAFVSIYESRVCDLRRIATSGTGILEEGDLHPDLISRFADEAGKAADHLLRMCVRAVDYCPPCDLTFGDYLRALITLDSDLFPEDELRYRIALIQAFRGRGIFPKEVRTLSEDSLRWRAPSANVIAAVNMSPRIRQLLSRLSAVGDLVRRTANHRDTVSWPLADVGILEQWPAGNATAEEKRAINNPPPRDDMPVREAIYHLLRMERIHAKYVIEDAINLEMGGLKDEVLEEAGLLIPGQDRLGLEVHALNFADRPNASGRIQRDFILWIKRRKYGDQGEMPFIGGATIVGDCDTGMIRYIVRKSANSSRRQNEEIQFHATGLATAYGRGFTYFGGSPFAGPGSRFAMIHGDDDHEEASHA